MSYIDLNTIPNYLLENKEVVYWVSKKIGESIRFRAYKIRQERECYSLLDKKYIAEIYIFLHKENHGSCIGIIKGKGLKHYESQEKAFETISKELKVIYELQ